ncbi:class I SAM-dependent methyltransferase [Microbacterium paludicola]|uniref:Class I SAM-dependent methyltransferase n=1 Tax=Microbacterium paludicola TaxID=300019 RepID=A0A4Y9FQY8_9MICO|nr:class I SAM-dependent methyltransferase [Microbacterium paludicola]MBF0817513.1 class I SAM-dependent methyltransferase [Microbacterium paludicola]TFU30913.1 class I SAM-dependent methyltransferase [Microbacterium paludicola]
MSQNTPQDPSLGSVRPSLTDLAIRFGTDKWGGDGNFQHWYTPHYERHLGHLRDEEFMLLEIGIGGYASPGQGGASLRMWKEFFPRAQIVGLDIQDKEFVREPRIHPHRGSQDDPSVIEQIVAEHGRPTVVVDDGSHNPQHIRATFGFLFPLLADGGIYAIEDTQTSYWPAFGGSPDLQDRTKTMGLVKDLLDGLNWEEWRPDGAAPTYTDAHVVAIHAYHNLVIIEKGENRENGNRTPVR